MKRILDMVPGQGDPLANEDTGASDELALDIANKLREGHSLSDIEKLLDAPASTLSSTLRRQRRKMALVLHQGLAPDLVDVALKYNGLLRQVIDILTERKNVGKMKTKDLIALAGYLEKWLAPIRKGALFEPPPEPHIPEQQQNVTVQLVQALVHAAHSPTPVDRQSVQTLEVPIETDAPTDPPRKDS